MEKLTLTSHINAPAAKVWEVLWGKDTYPQWTTVFSETSNVESDWQEGSKILFTDGSACGMVALIEKLVPNKFMSFKHLGEVKNGVEDTESDAIKQWAGAHENYTLTEENGATDLLVEMDITDDTQAYFRKTFPQALEIVKKLSEEA